MDSAQLAKHADANRRLVAGDNVRQACRDYNRIVTASYGDWDLRAALPAPPTLPTPSAPTPAGRK
jgi:hypothetical protein